MSGGDAELLRGAVEVGTFCDDYAANVLDEFFGELFRGGDPPVGDVLEILNEVLERCNTMEPDPARRVDRERGGPQGSSNDLNYGEWKKGQSTGCTNKARQGGY